METTLLAIGLAVLYLALVLAVEYVRRRFKLNAEITRRFAHISAGTCSVIYFQLLPSPHFLILTAISLIVVIFSQRFWLVHLDPRGKAQNLRRDIPTPWRSDHLGNIAWGSQDIHP